MRHEGGVGPYPRQMTDSVFGPPSSRSWGRQPKSGVIRRPGSASEAAVASLRRGDASFAAGEHAVAAREYVDALETLDGRPTELMVDAYLRLGRANHALGRVTACLHCYKKGLELDPQHAPTLRALVELHLAWNEHAEAEAVERRLFRAAETSEELSTELMRSGDRWWKRAGDPERAKQRYRRALSRSERSDRVVARLRAISSTAQRSELSILRARAQHAKSDAERAQAYFDLGTAAWFEHRDHQQASAAFEAAFIADRTLVAALEMLVTILVERGEYGRLEVLAVALAEHRDDASVLARRKVREALRALPEGALRSQMARRRTLS